MNEITFEYIQVRVSLNKADGVHIVQVYNVHWCPNNRPFGLNFLFVMMASQDGNNKKEQNMAWSERTHSPRA